MEDGECKADGCLAFLVQLVSAVELLLYIGCDLCVEFFLHRREVIVDGIRSALGEERGTVEFQEVLLDEAAHDIGYIDCLRAAARSTLEAIGVNEGHKELKILLFPIVRRCREEEEMPCES